MKTRTAQIRVPGRRRGGVESVDRVGVDPGGKPLFVDRPGRDGHRDRRPAPHRPTIGTGRITGSDSESVTEDRSHAAAVGRIELGNAGATGDDRRRCPRARGPRPGSPHGSRARAPDRPRRIACPRCRGRPTAKPRNRRPRRRPDHRSTRRDSIASSTRMPPPSPARVPWASVAYGRTTVVGPRRRPRSPRVARRTADAAGPSD